MLVARALRNAAVTKFVSQIGRQSQHLQLSRCQSVVPAAQAGHLRDVQQAVPASSGYDAVQRIADVLDASVVGHEEVKEGLMLALIAREHAYIEGPPGTGKTFLAELLSQVAGLDFFFYQFHRDTRINELIGDSVLVREEDASIGGEVVYLKTKPGGLLKTEICVLDDISRAPGEALNVLLRLLNERTFDGQSIPLLTAIATGNPATDEFYNEPLDPANLDRFTVQMKMPGLVEGNCWEEALALMDLYEGARREEISDCEVDELRDAERALARQSLDDTYDDMMTTTISTRMKRLLLHLLDAVVEESSAAARGRRGSDVILISDRTFLVKSMKLLKAKAVLHGRREVIPSDLHAFKYLTTLRVPEAVHERISDIVDEVIDRWSNEDTIPSPQPQPIIQELPSQDHVQQRRNAADTPSRPRQAVMMRDGTVFVPEATSSKPENPNVAAWERWNKKQVASGAKHLQKRVDTPEPAFSDTPEPVQQRITQDEGHEPTGSTATRPPTMEEVFENTCYGQALRKTVSVGNSA